MTRKVVTQVLDDIDGTDGARELTFALDGVTYQIDLAEKNEAKLRNALKPFMEAGRRGKSSPPRRRTRGSTAEVREWATAQGIPVPSRGKIPMHVQEAFDNR
jgi:hypothetical protein